MHESDRLLQQKQTRHYEVQHSPSMSATFTVCVYSPGLCSGVPYSAPDYSIALLPLNINEYSEIIDIFRDGYPQTCGFCRPLFEVTCYCCCLCLVPVMMIGCCNSGRIDSYASKKIREVKQYLARKNLQAMVTYQVCEREHGWKKFAKFTVTYSNTVTSDVHVLNSINM